ncbi:MAG: ABC transporter substrate-binding protein [Candidatus Bipolaricaulota bacterium]|nr:ABC transporter substrate-binding protein [Candidatus Bipolaricaulota bacterium]
MRKFLAALVAVGFVLGGWAQVRVVDQAGREVLIPSEPQRIVSAFGVATPYLYALVEPARIVAARYLGVPDHPLARALMAQLDPDYAAKALPGDITVEEILARRADLVVAGLRHRDLARLLGEVGIPTILVGPETFEAVRETTLLLAHVLGREEKASRLLAFYESVLAAAAQATAGILPEERPRVLVVGTAPLRVASGAMYQSRLVELAGGRPVTQGLPGSWQNVNLEQILLWNPEVVFIVPYSPVSPADLLGDPLWQATAAVQTGRVYKMPQILFAWDTPIPESALALLWMARRLHPERVQVDLIATIQAFYREFYGCEPRSEELSALLGG